ncbi:MAG: methyltransferase domain-containing protein [Planctomycetes bacterium]|nr:methyltransferase domain-containing protein [Planctomycetota bacterium]
MSPDDARPSTAATLPATPHPRLHALLRGAEAVWSERGDLRALYGSITNPEYWAWLRWHAHAEYPELAAADFPWPPMYLVERVGGDSTVQTAFREGGIVDWRRMVVVLQAAGFKFEGASVLDFGCGCGRLLRHFARYAVASRFMGVDVDPTPIAWCRENLDFAEFASIPLLPPMALPRGGFDALYTYSVFSHLPLESQRAWLAEFARLLRPGGLAVITYHGERAVERWLAGETPSEAPSPEQLRADLPRLEAEGILFFAFGEFGTPHQENMQHWERLDRAQYGNVFVTRAFIMREWLQHFALVAHYPSPDDWQDYVVLRRR